MKPATKVVRGPLVDLLGRAELLDPAAVHDRDPVGHRERLLLVVGDVDEGDADLALDSLQLHLQPLAELQVERAERLVQQQHLRQVHEGTREGHALLLPPESWLGLPVDLRSEPDALELLRDPPFHLGLRDLLAAQAEGDVLLTLR